MRRILFRVVCSSVLLFSYVANGLARNKPRGTDQRDVRCIEEQETRELPFTLLDGYLIVVEGRIGT
ncbi:MAG TPA: hypothetical protein VIX91_04290, partial [Candidatus Acidoferrum sp.]